MPIDAQRIVEIVFRGTDETGAATASAIRNTDDFAAGIAGARDAVAGFTVGALQVEAAIAAIGAALLGVAINQASSFQGAVLDLQKVLDDSDGPIDQYAQSARQIGVEFGVASTEVLGSISNFRQAGFTALEAVQLTRDALNLKIAGDVEAAQASELLIASLRGFGLEATEATRIVDLLNEVSNRYATNLPELAEGFARLSPVARAAGLSLEETAGLLTPGIEIFRSGSEVANGLRTVLIRLTDDSRPVQEALTALGVAQRDANGDLRSGRDIYFDVAEALLRTDENQRLFIAGQLAGTEQAARFLAVATNLSTTLRIAGTDFQYAGSAAQEVAIRLQAAETQFARSAQAINEAFIAIGTPLLDEAAGIAGGIASIFGTITDAIQSGPLSGLADYIESLFGQLLTTVQTVARNLPAALAQADLSGFQRGIEVVIDAVTSLFGELDLSSPEGLQRAIEALGTAFLNFQTFVSEVIRSFEPLIDLLFSAGEGVNGLGADFFAIAGNVSGVITQFSLLANTLGTFAGVLTPVIALIGANSAVSLAGSIGEVATRIAGAGGLISLLGQGGLVAAAGAGGFAVGNVLAPAIDGLVSSVTGTETSLGGFIYDLVNGRREIEQFAAGAGTAGPALELVGAAAQRAAVATRELADPLQQIEQSIAAVSREAAALTDNFDDQVNQQIALSERLESAARANDAFFVAVRGGREILVESVPVYDAAGQTILYYENRASGAAAAQGNLTAEQRRSAESMRQAEDETRRSADALREYQLEMERLRSAETIESLRLSSEIATAQIEADTARITAAFTSVDATIQSTGETIASLTDTFAQNTNFLSFSDQRVVLEQLENENRRRDEALELQRELTEAQINELRARTESLANGDALITVDGAGLQPHLEAFMFEILRAIQVRVNQDGLELLVGT